MSTCQLVFLEHSVDRVLLDLVPLEPIEVNRAVVPQGMPLTVTFLPNDDRSTGTVGEARVLEFTTTSK